VRFAYSAFSAATGISLLGLAIFGRPDIYLHAAEQQLGLLRDDSSGSELSGADGTPSLAPPIQAAAPSTLTGPNRPAPVPQSAPMIGTERAAVPELPPSDTRDEAAQTAENYPLTVPVAPSASSPSTTTPPVLGPRQTLRREVIIQRPKGATPGYGSSVLARIRQWSRELIRTVYRPPLRHASYRMRQPLQDARNLSPNGIGGGGG
jgi:hypothetical protein